MEVKPIDGVLLPKAREGFPKSFFDPWDLWGGTRGRAVHVGAGLRHEPVRCTVEEKTGKTLMLSGSPLFTAPSSSASGRSRAFQFPFGANDLRRELLKPLLKRQDDAKGRSTFGDLAFAKGTVSETSDYRRDGPQNKAAEPAKARPLERLQ